MASPVCVPKTLTPAQATLANRRGIEINPANAGEQNVVERTPTGRRGGPRRLALLVGSRWPASGVRLTVQFLDNPSKSLRKRILKHMNAWDKTANVNFEETNGIGMVRIARLDDPAEMAGYWSYVGTQILGIEDDQPTFNLEGFTMRTSEAEFRRVVRHEAGHTLGFEHEHMRAALIKKIDRRKAVAYFDRECGWTRQETIEQVLTPLSRRSIMGTRESDPLSIMCYEIPGEITKDGEPIVGGIDINENDYRFAAKVYPKPRAQSASVAQDRPSFVRRSTEPSSLPNEDTLHIVIMDDFRAELKNGADVSTDRERPRFARVFASYSGARVTSAMRLRAAGNEPPTSYGNIIRMHERIKKYTDRERGTLPSDDQMVKFGTDLFETLFHGDVRRLYDEARASQGNEKLDIVLTSMIPWIAEKPWEFAYDPVRQSFLATEEVHLVRNVLTAIPASSVNPLRGPLRILVVAAQPVGLGYLSAEQEISVIRRGFELLIEQGLASVEVLARATTREIQKYLSTGDFSVVHVIGHGLFDAAKQEGTLLLENNGGGAMALGERSAREIFCKRGVSLVFLNACQSGSGGRNDFNKGVAQSLVSHGLPAVVANQYSVLDSSATSFSQHFYWALAQGMSIGQAACESRIAVNCSMRGEPIDWAVPVVYARDPNMALCEPTDDDVTQSVARTIASRRRRQPRREVRVAVWDTDSTFPALEKTLETMNDSQSMVGFELVSLSTPIDGWYLEEKASDGRPYLWAEKFASRLGNATTDLQVDLLACITRHWMCDDETLNIYGWWPGDRKPPVAIFSCAGFDLAAEGRLTDRAIANVSVSMLTGFLGEMGTHTGGSKACPMFYNDDRDISHLVGRQTFDQRCKKRIEKQPGLLRALESLLAAFE